MSEEVKLPETEETPKIGDVPPEQPESGSAGDGEKSAGTGTDEKAKDHHHERSAL